MSRLYDFLVKVWDWLYEKEIILGILEAILATAIITILAFTFRSIILVAIKRLLPRLESKTPHVNFEVKSKRKKGKWESYVTVSNASNEPAYNLYVHFFEQFVGENFKIRASSADDEISRSVLGIHDSLEFKIDGVKFEGCSATCDQQIWVEYDNSLGVSFRVVSIPTAPRGDLPMIKPPQIIQRRFERMPGATLEGNKKLARKAVKGKVSYLPKVKRRTILKYHIYDKPLWRIKDLFRHKA